MNDQIAKQATEFMNAASKAEIPAQVRAIAEDSVAKAKEAYGTFNAAAQNGAKAMEDVIHANQASAKTVSETVMSNVMANTEAAFDAAQKLARAKSLPEVFQLQAKFAQDQMTKLTEQAKGLFELSGKVSKETTDKLASIATKAVNDAKKAG